MKVVNLNFSPKSIHGVYGINYYFSKNGKQQRVQLEVTISYCGKYMDDYAIYHVSKGEFIVNRNESDEYLYDIAKKCAAAIYPLSILVNKKGKLAYIKTDDIPQKWVDARANIEQYYKGETTKQYLNNVEKFLNNKTQIQQLITRDLFFNHLFALVYQYAGAKYDFENEIALVPFKAPLKCQSTQTADMESALNEQCKAIKLIHCGYTKQAYPYGALYSKQGMDSNEYNRAVTAEYQSSYMLDKDSLRIDSIESDCKILVDNERFSTIKFTAFRLFEKPLEYEKDKYFTETEKEQKKKDNSWLEKVKDYFNS